jgi:FK506-binding protein 2
MCIGEKRTLTIPPNLGYGDRGIGPIPPGSTLSNNTEAHILIERLLTEVVFETELTAIDGVEPPPVSVKETVSDTISGATEAAKATIADADGAEHNEL